MVYHILTKEEFQKGSPCRLSPQPKQAATGLRVPFYEGIPKNPHGEPKKWFKKKLKQASWIRMVRDELKYSAETPNSIWNWQKYLQT